MADDIEGRLTQLKLRLLDEKLEKHKQRIGNNKYRSIVENDRQEALTFRDADLTSRSQIVDLKLQVEEAKREQLLLRQKLESQKYYQEKPETHSGRQSRSNDKNNSSMPRAANAVPSAGGIDPIQNMMQMMMMQQQQMQSMVMGQMMLGNNGSRQQPAAAPIIIPPSQPQMVAPPYYPPYQPSYPPYVYDRMIPWSARQRPLTSRSRDAPVATPIKRVRAKEFPFPGNGSQQRIRRLAYAAFFCASLYRLAQENKFRPSQDFIFDLRLKEVISALHRIYMAPDGQVYGLLAATTIGYECYEFQDLLSVPKKLDIESEKKHVQEVSHVLENLTFQITDIMPRNGILGTNRNSGIYEMIITGQKFPQNFFFDIEHELIVVNKEDRTEEVSDEAAIMLIAGVFIIRALVNTMFMKPMFYGFIPDPGPHPTAQRNLQLLNSLFMYIYRRIIAILKSSKDQSSKKVQNQRLVLPPVPQILIDKIIPDRDLEPVLKLCKKSLDYVENLILEWGREYVKRIREAAF